MARRSLTGTALLWYRAERIFKTWDEFKAAILKEFPDNIDAKAIHELMSSRHKKSSESCLEYLFTMKELGKRGKMPDYVAIKYIVEGIKDQEVNKIMLYGVTTYSDLKEKLKIYEQLKSNMASSSSSRDTSRSKQTEKNEKTYGRFVRCYSCGEKNHSSADCPHKEKGLKCFKCDEFGHIASQCKTAVSSSTASTSKSDVKPATSGEGGSAGKKWPTGTNGASVATKRAFYGSTSDGHIPSSEDVIGQSSEMAAKNCLLAVMAGDVNKTQQTITPKKKPVKRVHVLGKDVIALVDSGCEVSLMTIECYNNLGAPEFDKSDDFLTGLGENQVDCYGQICLDIEIDELWYKDVKFRIVPNRTVPYSMILGEDFLLRVRLVMEYNNVWLIPLDRWVCEIRVCDSLVTGSSEDVEKRVNDLVESYVPRKTKEAPVKLKIVLKDDIPVAQRPRRLAPAEQEEVDRQVNKWLEDGVRLRMKLWFDWVKYWRWLRNMASRLIGKSRSLSNDKWSTLDM
ncbi:uncharacterized protein LOC134678007 isoform X2 [Cydia fagiglandana]|uniref:uncharacterized protein LOC134678007 isoform X2 n=1 Tax=Cydia fagiglandana TaxID=1458189 RepID=UPI002FEE5005